MRGKRVGRPRKSRTYEIGVGLEERHWVQNLGFTNMVA